MANGRYQHWFKDYQGMTGTDAYGYFYFALRYALLGNRLRLSLVANDPFRQHVTDEFIHNSRRFVVNANYVDSEKMNHTVHTLHHSHYIALTATYSLVAEKDVISIAICKIRNRSAQRDNRVTAQRFFAGALLAAFAVALFVRAAAGCDLGT